MKLDKEAFLASVVHELRSPLNACLMSLNLLELKASQPAEVLKCAEVVRRNLDRQARLIGDLGDIVQIATGGIEIVSAPVDLADVIDAAVDHCRAAAAERGVGIDWTRPAAGQVMEADADRLTRVFETLLENLTAATAPPGRIAIELAASDGASSVRLDGRAAGGGGPSAARLNEKGFAVRRTVAEQILQAHGGSLESQRGGFMVSLPLRGPPFEGR